MSYSEFVLKSTPPRLSRNALVRERLVRDADRIFDGTAMAVVAPAGFGKTTLLLQWRQRWLEQGARVAWLSADALDDPVRFAGLLSHALLALGSIDPADAHGLSCAERMTGVLAGIARRCVQVVVVVDDCERLPQATVDEVLQYMLLNAPANLHLALGARTALPLRTAELLARGLYRQVSVQELRLQEMESLAILQERLGDRLDLDTRMRLHEAAEGWPIGLQLAIAAIEPEANPAAAVAGLSSRRGSLQDYFNDSMQAAFADTTIEALARLAVVDRFDEGLGAVACGMPVAALIDQLMQETPILIACESAGWYRLHPLARDYLLGVFERLPIAMRTELHAQVSHWYGAAGFFHEAAEHALLAGDENLAHAHAAQALWALGAKGRIDEAREWLLRMPGVLAAKDLQVRLAAAVVLAFSERNEEGLQIAQQVLAGPGLTTGMGAVARRVASSAAAYADRPGLLQQQFADWPQIADASIDPLYRINRLNVESFLALVAGNTERVRSIALEVAGFEEQASLVLAMAIHRMLVAMAHLREGHPRQAQQLLRGALQQAEQRQGRRSMIACMYAAILASALHALDQSDAAQQVLADRLDMIERAGMPDNVLAAYTTLVLAAMARGDDSAAAHAIDGLAGIARQRRLPRLHLHALALRIRLQVANGRVGPELLDAIDALEPVFSQPELQPYRSEYQRVAATSHAIAALAGGNLVEARRQLEIAAEQAALMADARSARAILALRVVVAKQGGDREAFASLLEAFNRAGLAADTRLLADTHPMALGLVKAVISLPSVSARPLRGPHQPREPDPSVSALLTPKETEILALLERGLSNKRIAMALGVGAETVKWHLKNLFSKLSAASREHAVDRARLLGLVG